MLHKKKEEYPKYLLRAFITVSAFSRANYKAGRRRGLLILLGPQRNLKKISSKFEGNLKDFFVEKYGNPILYSPGIFELYELMGKRDGALFFDTTGNLLASEIYVEGIKTSKILSCIKEIKEIKGSIGARHIAGAYASLYGLESVMLSEEKGTVITMRAGKIYRGLCYDPEKGFLNKFRGKAS